MNMWKKIAVTLSCAVVAGSLFAGAWGYQGPKRDIVTLVVTANYEQPRLIAELIQIESRQPFLLFPATTKGGIYFCPPSNIALPKRILKKDLIATVQMLNPQKIVVLGNGSYIPSIYVNELSKVAPVIVVTGDDWQKIADVLSPMLNLTSLPRDFAKLSAKLKKAYVPTAAPAEFQATIAMEEEVILPPAPATPAIPAETVAPAATAPAAVAVPAAATDNVVADTEENDGLPEPAMTE